MTTTLSDYDVVKAAIVKALETDIHTKVPGWAQGMIPSGLVPALAEELSKVSVDTLDAHRRNTTT